METVRIRVGVGNLSLNKNSAKHCKRDLNIYYLSLKDLNDSFYGYI